MERAFYARERSRFSQGARDFPSDPEGLRDRGARFAAQKLANYMSFRTAFFAVRNLFPAELRFLSRKGRSFEMTVSAFRHPAARDGNLDMTKSV